MSKRIGKKLLALMCYYFVVVMIAVVMGFGASFGVSVAGTGLLPPGVGVPAPGAPTPTPQPYALTPTPFLSYLII